MWIMAPFATAGGNIAIFDGPEGGARSTFGYSINSQGQVTGFYFASTGAARGFIREASGVITAFRDPAGEGHGTFPFAISDRTKITGGYRGSDSNVHGFLLNRQ